MRPPVSNGSHPEASSSQPKTGSRSGLRTRKGGGLRLAQACKQVYMWVHCLGASAEYVGNFMGGSAMADINPIALLRASPHLQTCKSCENRNQALHRVQRGFSIKPMARGVLGAGRFFVGRGPALLFHEGLDQTLSHPQKQGWARLGDIM